MRLNSKCITYPYESALHKLWHPVFSALCGVLLLRLAVIWNVAQRFALLLENGGQNARRDAEGQLKGAFITIFTKLTVTVLQLDNVWV